MSIQKNVQTVKDFFAAMDLDLRVKRPNRYPYYGVRTK